MPQYLVLGRDRLLAEAATAGPGSTRPTGRVHEAFDDWAWRYW